MLDIEKEKAVYAKVWKILLKYGKIHDEAIKFHGPLIVLDYGFGERKLKIEISNRQWGDHYEIKDLLEINIKVMVASDMFAHKFCALLDRNEITNRDIFDSWFFMKNHTPVNKSIVETRMEMPFEVYIQKSIDSLKAMSDKGMLNGLGELMDEQIKKFVRTKLRSETISLLQFYKGFPILAE